MGEKDTISAFESIILEYYGNNIASLADDEVTSDLHTYLRSVNPQISLKFDKSPEKKKEEEEPNYQIF